MPLLLNTFLKVPFGMFKGVRRPARKKTGKHFFYPLGIFNRKDNSIHITCNFLHFFIEIQRNAVINRILT